MNQSKAAVLGADQIVIEGVTYNVIARDTAEAMEARGLKNVTEYMRDVGIVAQLCIKRPNGKRHFHTHAYENGRFSKVIAL